MKTITKLLIFIFLLVFLYFGFSFWRASFSKEKVKLEISAPEKVVAGEEVEYIVKCKNNGNFRLEDPELLFEFPENSLSEEGWIERKILKDEFEGPIYPGQEKTFSFKVRLFGKEGELKTARASLSFRPKNLKARYLSQTSFTTQISSVPLTFEFDFPALIFPQREFSFKVHYFSNASSLLQNLKIFLDFPVGFETKNKNEWEIPILNRFEGGKIEISGMLYGEAGEVKIFKARLGMIINDRFVLLKEVEKGIQLAKPFIFVRQEINKNPEYIATPGEWLHYEIYFKNLGEETLKNLFLICTLEGEAFDFETLKSETGNYEPGDNSIVFDWKQNPKLENLLPKEEGKVEFWIKLKDEIKDAQLKNKVLISQVKEEFVTKVSTKIKVTQKGFFEDEVGFQNSGPLPPKVGQTTTYTIIWTVEGGVSRVTDLKLKANLPENVSLTGKIFPQQESTKFSFDPEKREILWTIDVLEAKEKRSLAFQVALSPTEKDRGKIPVLVGTLNATGKDSWTETEVNATSKEITTLLSEDSLISPDKAKVE